MAADQLSKAPSDGTVLGQSATDKVGLYGATPVVQPSATAQSAVATDVVTAVATTAITTAVSTALTGTFGFVTQAQGDAIVAAVNSLIARGAANTTAINSLITQGAANMALVNAIRSALVTEGAIKGAA